MSLKHQVVVGLLWSAVDNWGRQVIAFAIFALLARILGAEAFGQIALANVFMSFIQIFVHQGFTVAIVQKSEIDDEHLDTAFWSNFLISIFLCILSICFAGNVASIFKEIAIKPVIQCLSINFILYALCTVQDSILRRKMQFKALAIRSIFSIIGGGIVGCTMALTGYGIWSLVGKQLAEGLIGSITLWRASDWRPGFRISIQKFKDLSSFGISILGIEISNYFSTNSDNLIIGYVLGSVALGHYSIAYKFIYVSIGFISAVISNVTMPIFSRLQKKPDDLKKLFYTASKLSGVINIPFFAVFAILAREITIICFGEKWLPSVQTMQVFALVGIYRSLEYIFVDLIVAIGKPQLRLKIMLASSIINLILFVLVVRWGILAVAIALAIQCFLVAIPLYLLAIKRTILIDFNSYIQQFYTATLCTIIIVLIITFAKFSMISLLSLPVFLSFNVLTSVVTYGILLKLIDPLLFKYLLNLLPMKNES